MLGITGPGIFVLLLNKQKTHLLCRTVLKNHIEEPNNRVRYMLNYEIKTIFTIFKVFLILSYLINKHNWGTLFF